MLEPVYELFQLTGDYSDNDLKALNEILEANYRGTIQQKGDEEGSYLMAFTFPAWKGQGRSKDGLRYVQVSANDIKEVK